MTKLLQGVRRGFVVTFSYMGLSTERMEDLAKTTKEIFEGHEPLTADRVIVAAEFWKSLKNAPVLAGNKVELQIIEKLCMCRHNGTFIFGPTPFAEMLRECAPMGVEQNDPASRSHIPINPQVDLDSAPNADMGDEAARIFAKHYPAKERIRYSDLFEGADFSDMDTIEAILGLGYIFTMRD